MQLFVKEKPPLERSKLFLTFKALSHESEIERKKAMCLIGNCHSCFEFKTLGQFFGKIYVHFVMENLQL